MPTTEIIEDSVAKKTGTAVLMSIVMTVVGGFVGVCLIVAGLAISFTIIGAIFGIPMMLFGFGLLVGSPLTGFAAFGLKKADCPYCHNKLTFHAKKAMDCRYCKKRLLINGNHLSMVE